MRHLPFLASFVIVAVFAAPTLAWNALGHEVVAEIAWQQLSAEQRQNIVDILRRHPRFDTDFANEMDDDTLKGDKASQDHWVFLHAATWPDQIRGIEEYDRPTWHYIDFPLYVDDSDRLAFADRLPVNISTEYPTKTPPEKMNAYQAIRDCQKVLAGNASADVKARAYCWLFHLVGDVHQPLHSTALFSEYYFNYGDRGGNEIPLARGRNLHSLWDGLLGGDLQVSNIAKVARELSDRKRFGAVWDTAGSETDPKEWIRESHELAVTSAYSAEIVNAVRNAEPYERLEPIDLPEAYYKTAGEQARKRVLAAGLRLGTLLKTVNQ